MFFFWFFIFCDEVCVLWINFFLFYLKREVILFLFGKDDKKIDKNLDNLNLKKKELFKK